MRDKSGYTYFKSIYSKRGANLVEVVDTDVVERVGVVDEEADATRR